MLSVKEKRLSRVSDLFMYKADFFFLYTDYFLAGDAVDSKAQRDVYCWQSIWSGPQEKEL